MEKFIKRPLYQRAERCLLAVLLLVMSISVAAQVPSKETLSFECKNESLASAFQRLERASGYKILFTYEDVQSYRATVSMKNRPVTAIMDALLGAAALGDIGKHFPDTDPAFEGADSLKLLEETVRLVKEEGYKVGNVDATVIAQKPKLASYIPRMRENIRKVLEVEENQVNIKATTEEHLGFTGEGLGISAQAVCLLEER